MKLLEQTSAHSGPLYVHPRLILSFFGSIWSQHRAPGTSKIELPSRRNANFHFFLIIFIIITDLAILRVFRVVLGPSWAILGHLGAILGHLKRICGHPGTVLGPSCANLQKMAAGTRKMVRVVPSATWTREMLIFVSWVILGASWGHHELSRAILCSSWGHLRSSWAILGPS